MSSNVLARKAYDEAFNLERQANVGKDGAFDPDGFFSAKNQGLRLQSVAKYSEAIALDANYKQAYLRRAVLHSCLGNDEMAWKDVQAVLLRNPTPVECHVLGVAVRGRLGVKVLEQGLRLTDESDPFWHTLASSLAIKRNDSLESSN